MWKNLGVLLTGLLLLLGLASSKFSAQLGVVAGSEGVGSIPLENYPQANSVGSAVLALILFDGRTAHLHGLGTAGMEASTNE
jgi:cell volume regulation protein A